MKEVGTESEKGLRKESKMLSTNLVAMHCNQATPKHIPSNQPPGTPRNTGCKSTTAHETLAYSILDSSIWRWLWSSLIGILLGLESVMCVYMWQKRDCHGKHGIQINKPLAHHVNKCKHIYSLLFNTWKETPGSDQGIFQTACMHQHPLS